MGPAGAAAVVGPGDTLPVHATPPPALLQGARPSFPRRGVTDAKLLHL